jgi:RNA polymerase sigma-70 factor (ECF subfamily)
MGTSYPRDRSWTQLQQRFLEYRESGEAEATRHVFTELDAILKAYFHAKTKRAEDALDLSQATLLKIHLHRLAFRSELPLRSWVFTIASRQLTDHWRSLGRSSSRVDSEIQVETLAQASRELVGLEDREQCETLLAHLSADERELLRAYAVEDLAVRDIAETRGIAEGTMKVKLHRIYKNLRKIAGPGVLLLAMGLIENSWVQPTSTFQRIIEVEHLHVEVL